LYSVLLEPAITGEMPGVLPKDTLVEVLERGGAVDVAGDDPGPVVGAAVAGGPLRESL